MARQYISTVYDVLSQSLPLEKIFQTTRSAISFTKEDKTEATIFFDSGHIYADSLTNYSIPYGNRIVTHPGLAPHNKEIFLSKYSNPSVYDPRMPDFVADRQMLFQSQLTEITNDFFLGIIDEIISWENVSAIVRKNYSTKRFTIQPIDIDSLLSLTSKRIGRIAEIAQEINQDFYDIKRVQVIASKKNQARLEDEYKNLVHASEEPITIIELAELFGRSTFKTLNMLFSLWKRDYVYFMNGSQRLGYNNTIVDFIAEDDLADNTSLEKIDTDEISLPQQSTEPAPEPETAQKPEPEPEEHTTVFKKPETLDLPAREQSEPVQETVPEVTTVEENNQPEPVNNEIAEDDEPTIVENNVPEPEVKEPVNNEPPLTEPEVINKDANANLISSDEEIDSFAHFFDETPEPSEKTEEKDTVVLHSTSPLPEIETPIEENTPIIEDTDTPQHEAEQTPTPASTLSIENDEPTENEAFSNQLQDQLSELQDQIQGSIGQLFGTDSTQSSVVEEDENDSNISEPATQLSDNTGNIETNEHSIIEIEDDNTKDNNVMPEENSSTPDTGNVNLNAFSLENLLGGIQSKLTTLQANVAHGADRIKELEQERQNIERQIEEEKARSQSAQQELANLVAQLGKFAQ